MWLRHVSKRRVPFEMSSVSVQIEEESRLDAEEFNETEPAPLEAQQAADTTQEQLESGEQDELDRLVELQTESLYPIEQ